MLQVTVPCLMLSQKRQHSGDRCNEFLVIASSLKLSEKEVNVFGNRFIAYSTALVHNLKVFSEKLLFDFWIQGFQS